MKLTTLFDNNAFVVTGEVGPIKGAVNRDKNIDATCTREAKYLQGWVHAVNVTDNQSAVMRLGSLAASVTLNRRAWNRSINSPAGTATASPCKAIC
jgi:methylenetetrahydrofolate reductase (NADPH)